MHSRTMNKIYPLGGRHATLQAGTWSYGRRGSSTGWPEGAFPLGGGPQMNPTTGRGAPEGEVKLARPPAEGSVLPDLTCLVCHCNVSRERRVLIVGEDVREHGFEVIPMAIDHYFLVGQRENRLLFKMAACPIFCLAFKRKRLYVHVALSCT